MVNSEISINLLTGMVTLKLLLSVLKFFGFVFWSRTNSMLILFPPFKPPFVVALLGRWEWGLCRSELSEDMNTNGNTSHIRIEPPIQKQTPLVAEPYLSRVVVLSLHVILSGCGPLLTALGNCRNTM